MLLFGQATGEGRARLERRIVLAPSLAKQLAASLADAVRAYEARSGGGNATPAGRIESVARDEDAPAAARPLLGLVRGLGAGFGFEKSFKMSAGGVRGDRVILGVRTRLAGEGALAGVCRGIGMPADYLAQFEARLGEANTAGFGFEGDTQGGVYKVYLEFWEGLWGRVQRDPGNVSPALLFLGFKWSVKDSSRRALARYTCHPLLSVPAIARRIAILSDGPSLQAARDILALAAARVGGDSFVYVEAEEEGNPRRSFDLNFYKARLRIADLAPVLRALAKRYKIKHLGKLIEETGHRPFGHLSGGV